MFLLVDRRVTDIRSVIVQAFLFAGLLGWGTINTYITSIVNKAVEGAGVKEGFIYGFLPVGLITLILIQVNPIVPAAVASPSIQLTFFGRSQTSFSRLPNGSLDSKAYRKWTSSLYFGIPATG